MALFGVSSLTQGAGVTRNFLSMAVLPLLLLAFYLQSTIILGENGMNSLSMKRIISKKQEDKRNLMKSHKLKA